ncbi:MAG TPA: hypothetical protein VF342_00755 [Alphaproteobacteria bacterium]
MLRVLSHLLSLVVLGAYVAMSGMAVAADRFVIGIEDMPLMPGLVVLADRGVVFDAPAGRIIEAYAEGAVARDSVRDFYARTLPQLGWRATGPDRFVREGETLRLEFLDPREGADGRRLMVRFFISPE